MTALWLVPTPIPPEEVCARTPPGAALLALRAAQLAAWDALPGREVIPLESLVPHAASVELAHAAAQLAHAVGEIASAGQTLSGYDLPALGWQEQEYFLREALLAARLGRALAARGVTALHWLESGAVQGDARAQQIAQEAVLGVLRAAFGGPVLRVPAPPSTPGSAPMPAAWRRKWSLGRALIARRFTYRPPTIRRARVAAVFPLREWERYSEPLGRLRDELGDDLQIYSMGQPTETLRTWTSARGFAPVWQRYPRRVDAHVTSFFRDLWARWQAHGRYALAERARAWGGDVLTGPAPAARWEYEFLHVWPRLAQWACELERALRAARTELVIGSSDWVPAYALPHHVARQLAIPSVALRHAMAPQGNVPSPATFFGCRTRFEAVTHGDGAPGFPRILLCHDAANALSYRPADDAAPLPPTASANPPAPPIVLMLVSDEDQGPTLMSKIDRPAFVETFRRLLSPPSDLAGLEFVFKAHPRYDVAALLAALAAPAGPPPNVRIVDPRSSLDRWLAHAWVVVVCNYFGSAAAQAALPARPVLFLHTAANTWPGASHLALEAGPVVNTVDAFWDALRAARDHTTYAQWASQARTFRDTYLEPQGPPFAAMIRSLLDSTARA